MKILKISWEHYEVKKLSRALKEYKPNFEDIHNKNCEEIKDIAISLNLKDIDSFIENTLEEQKKYDDVLIQLFSNLSEE